MPSVFSNGFPNEITTLEDTVKISQDARRAWRAITSTLLFWP